MGVFQRGMDPGFLPQGQIDRTRLVISVESPSALPASATTSIISFFETPFGSKAFAERSTSDPSVRRSAALFEELGTQYWSPWVIPKEGFSLMNHRSNPRREAYKGSIGGFSVRGATWRSIPNPMIEAFSTDHIQWKHPSSCIDLLSKRALSFELPLLYPVYLAISTVLSAFYR